MNLLHSLPAGPAGSDDADDAERLLEALVETGRWLQSVGYAFTTVTPATHARVNARPAARQANDWRDVFGWSRPFVPALLPAAVRRPLERAGLLAPAPGGMLRSEVRYSTLHGLLFAHSAYPTTEVDAVFFGPDTQRFVDLVMRELERQPARVGARILDVGCGAGAGGLLAARHATMPARPVLADLSARALHFARANAHVAGLPATFVQGDLYAPVDGTFDLIIANPPYLNDSAGRTYRDGGGTWGEALSLRIVREGLARLAPGGRLVLYTGVPVVDGTDPLWASLRRELSLRGWPYRYREIDPDVFGEELQEPAYAAVERIAAVSLVVERPTTDPLPLGTHPAMA